MTDAAVNRKLDEILAGQARAAGRDAEILGRIGGLDEAMRHVIAAITALNAPLGALGEAVEKLSEAAAPAKPKSDIGDVLRGIERQLGELTSQTDRVAKAMERLPEIMEDTALNAAKLATGDGVEPKPKS